MAYSTIDKSTDYFNTHLYTGNGGTQSITGVGFQPDWTILKGRNASNSHNVYDAVRGAGKTIVTDANYAESTDTARLTSFDSDGFSLGSNANVNENNINFVSWNWKAGGTAPSQTYTVKVVSDSGNKYRFDDFGTSAVTLDLQEGGTYTFDQSDSSNAGHPLRFSTTSNGSHGGGSEYTTGVTTTGTPGSSGAKTVITVASGAATLYYYCTNHSNMGGQANTNSLFGSSNFSGSVQSTVSTNTTAGFSIVTYTGTGNAGATIGHGLGAVPKWILIKKRAGGTARDWAVYHGANTSAPETEILYLNNTDATADSAAYWHDTAPTSNIITLGAGNEVNESPGHTYVAYCFAEKTGYSKFGSYTGNGNADGTFVYTGFKPAFVIIKSSSYNGSNWHMYDTKRNTFNVMDKVLKPDDSTAEITPTNTDIDCLSNGFKLKGTDAATNESGGSLIYMAFGQSLVGSNNVPCTAR